MNSIILDVVLLFTSRMMDKVYCTDILLLLTRSMKDKINCSGRPFIGKHFNEQYSSGSHSLVQ